MEKNAAFTEIERQLNGEHATADRNSRPHPAGLVDVQQKRTTGTSNNAQC
ncbi:hypothetical protein ACQP2X_17500 [Actinoplanes sp. CA-131856]